MIIKYLKEGYFKNPEQARTARAKEKELSSREEIANIATNINNTYIKNEMQKVISAALEKTSAFPFSSIFAQPIGGVDFWDLTNDKNNLRIVSVNDDEKIIECVIDGGIMHSRGESTNTPVKCLVAVTDPRGKKGELSQTSSPEEVLSAITERSLNVIKNKATKQLKSRTLPKSEVFLRAALEKIIEYKFVIKSVSIGVVGTLRLKNMLDYNIISDESVKDMLFSLITFTPLTADACIKFKNSKNKEIDSGVSFNDKSINDFAKSVVDVAIRKDVSCICELVKCDLNIISKNDASPIGKNVKKCQPAVKAINTELLSYLAKIKTATVKNVQFTYERMTYDIINLQTKATTEEIDNNKVYGRSIKITYSLAGDTEDSYIYITRTKNSWYSSEFATNLANKSAFLKNGIIPSKPIEHIKGNVSFYDSNVRKYLEDSETSADATNVFLAVYCSHKYYISINGSPLKNIGSGGVQATTYIQNISHGKYKDLTNNDITYVNNGLAYIYNLAVKMK